MKYYFLPIGPYMCEVYDKTVEPAINPIVGEVHNGTFIAKGGRQITNDVIDEVMLEFNNDFSGRPEYMLYDISKLYSGHISKAKDIMSQVYDCLMTGCRLSQLYKNSHADFYDDTTGNIKNCKFSEDLEKLHMTDFYTAPASTRFHDAFEGGLLYHTLKVTYNLMMLFQTSFFSKVDYVQAVIVALVHDWCKINVYVPYNRNVKNEVTGQWEQVLSFRKEDSSLPLGHGVESLVRAQTFFPLNNRQRLAIRWHMGPWNVAPNEMNDLQKANEIEPMCHLIQFADQLSITDYC